MAVTILESLRNANYNLKDPVGSSTIQLIMTKVEPLLERYGNVKDVPLKDIANDLV